MIRIRLRYRQLPIVHFWLLLTGFVLVACSNGPGIAAPTVKENAPESVEFDQGQTTRTVSLDRVFTGENLTFADPESDTPHRGYCEYRERHPYHYSSELWISDHYSHRHERGRRRQPRDCGHRSRTRRNNERTDRKNGSTNVCCVRPGADDQDGLTEQRVHWAEPHLLRSEIE